ncbi:MAG: hypothetical protein WCG25_09415 [bacterium]
MLIYIFTISHSFTKVLTYSNNFFSSSSFGHINLILNQLSLYGKISLSNSISSFDQASVHFAIKYRELIFQELFFQDVIYFISLTVHFIT